MVNKHDNFTSDTKIIVVRIIADIYHAACEEHHLHYLAESHSNCVIKANGYYLCLTHEEMEGGEVQ